MPQTIHETSCVIVKVRIGLIDFELIKKGGEPFHIILDGGGLVDMEHLASEFITLIAPKPIMKEFAKVRPRNSVGLLKGLNPASSSIAKMHAANLHPAARMHIIHIKVILGLCDPQSSVITLIEWEVEFRQAAIVIVGIIGGMVSNVVIIHGTVEDCITGIGIRGVPLVGEWVWGRVSPNTIRPCSHFDAVHVGPSSRDAGR